MSEDILREELLQIGMTDQQIEEEVAYYRERFTDPRGAKWLILAAALSGVALLVLVAKVF